MFQHSLAPAQPSTSTAPAPALGLRWRWAALALGMAALALGISALALGCAEIRAQKTSSTESLRWRWAALEAQHRILRWASQHRTLQNRHLWGSFQFSQSVSQFSSVQSVSFWPVTESPPSNCWLVLGDPALGLRWR